MDGNKKLRGRYLDVGGGHISSTKSTKDKCLTSSLSALERLASKLPGVDLGEGWREKS